MKKYAAYCGTREVYSDMETAAKSLIAHSDVDRVYFLIEDPEFPTPLPDIIECIDVSGQTFFPPDGANSNCRWTYMELMRSALCYVLPPEVGVVLSMDTDTFAIRDINELWDIDLDGCYFAGVREKWTKRRGFQYCNAGVCLYNLDMLRNGKADEIIEVLNSHEFGWPGQDATNYLCQGHVIEMPPEYNFCPWVVETDAEARIVHYAAEPAERWRGGNIPTRYRNLSWDEIMKSHERRCNESTAR